MIESYYPRQNGKASSYLLKSGRPASLDTERGKRYASAIRYSRYWKKLLRDQDGPVGNFVSERKNFRFIVRMLRWMEDADDAKRTKLMRRHGQSIPELIALANVYKRRMLSVIDPAKRRELYEQKSYAKQQVNKEQDYRDLQAQSIRALGKNNRYVRKGK